MYYLSYVGNLTDKTYKSNWLGLPFLMVLCAWSGQLVEFRICGDQNFPNEF